MQAAGAGVGGSQIFSLRSRKNFNPSNPVSWQKKSTIHFSKAPTKTVRAWIPSILGTIHFFIYTSPPPPTHSPPPPLGMAGSWIGELRFAFSKKATIFFILWTIFSNMPPKSQPIRVHQWNIGGLQQEVLYVPFMLFMLGAAREKSLATDP